MYAVWGYSFAAEMEKAVKNGMDGCEAANYAAKQMNKCKGKAYKAYQVSPDFVCLDTAEQFVAMCADRKAVLCVEIRQMSEHISERDHISLRYSKLKNNT